MSERPLDVLEDALGTTVTVHLKQGTTYHGTLSGYDQHLNVVLEPTGDEPDADPGRPGETVRDTTVIRGDNVVTIEP